MEANDIYLCEVCENDTFFVDMAYMNMRLEKTFEVTCGRCGNIVYKPPEFIRKIKDQIEV